MYLQNVGVYGTLTYSFDFADNFVSRNTENSGDTHLYTGDCLCGGHYLHLPVFSSGYGERGLCLEVEVVLTPHTRLPLQNMLRL